MKAETEGSPESPGPHIREIITHPRGVLLGAVGLLFLAETLSLWLLHLLEMPPLVEAALDALILVGFVVLVLYAVVYRPLMAHLVVHRQMAHSYRASLERTRLLLDHIFDGVITIDQRGIILSFNRAAERLFQREASEVIGLNINHLMPSPHREAHDRYISRYLKEGSPRIIGVGREVQGLRRDGTTFPADLAVTEVFTPEGSLFIGAMRDITERKEAEARLRAANEELERRVDERTAALRQAILEQQAQMEELRRVQAALDQRARTDGLTGILNRREFDGILRVEMARATRHGLPLSLLLLDIDHFKGINDAYGHIVGDTVLVGFTHRIQRHLRTHDVFARWGGEEFVVLVPQSDHAHGLALARRLCQLVAAEPFEMVARVTVSVGVASLTPHDTPETLIGRADKALYLAKSQGRDRAVGDDAPPGNSPSDSV